MYLPFSGVFSEVIGLMFAGYDLDDITTCEITEEYVEIGEARLKAWKELYEQGFTFDTKYKRDEIKKEISKKSKEKVVDKKAEIEEVGFFNSVD